MSNRIWMGALALLIVADVYLHRDATVAAQTPQSVVRTGVNTYALAPTGNENRAWVLNTLTGQLYDCFTFQTSRECQKFRSLPD